jgi:opacity protein-like surface antigen
MKLRFGIPAAAALILLSSAAPARADIVLTPFVGSLFGADLPDAKATYGVSAAFMGAGIIGGEIDFGFTPEFVPSGGLSPEVKAMSLMFNGIIGIPIGGTVGASVRPYVVGGIGLFRATWKDDDFLDRIDPESDFAFDLGGGIMGFFTDNIGIRGDVRYFRKFSEDLDDLDVDFTLGDLDFWRATVGASFKF